MLKNRIAMSAAAVLVAGILVPLTAQSASAQTITSYCTTNQYANTQLSTGHPTQALQCQMQFLASRYGYTGPINGVLGQNSWKGIMAYLADDWDYNGPVNGIPGVNTYKAMQRMGNAYGWSAAVTVDGSLGTRDWQNWAYGVRRQLTGE